MTSAFMSGVTVKRGNGATPEVFTSIGEVFSLSELGKTNALVDVTNFDSAGSREYISGLADGQEIKLDCNYLPANAQQLGLISDVNAKTRRNLQVLITDGVTPKTFSFTVAPISWVIAPSVDNRNVISFGLKISGDITVT